MAPQTPLCRVMDPDVGPDRHVEYVAVWSLEELERLLRESVRRHPRLLVVRLTDGLTLWVGIGGDRGGVFASPIPNAPIDMCPEYTAQPRRPCATEPREFVTETVPYTFKATELIPADEVIEIVLHFVRYRDLPDSHVWGPPGPYQYRWGEGGTREEWEERIRVYNIPSDLPF